MCTTHSLLHVNAILETDKYLSMLANDIAQFNDFFHCVIVIYYASNQLQCCNYSRDNMKIFHHFDSGCNLEHNSPF